MSLKNFRFDIKLGKYKNQLREYQLNGYHYKQNIQNCGHIFRSFPFFQISS